MDEEHRQKRQLRLAAEMPEGGVAAAAADRDSLPVIFESRLSASPAQRC